MIVTPVAFSVLALVGAYNVQFKLEIPTFKKAVNTVVATLVAVSCSSLPAHALSKSEVLQLSYEQVKGSGLANRCSSVKGEGTINIAPGKKLQITDLCVEPTSWQVEEEVGTNKGVTQKQFVNTKLMTRQTYTLEGISGDLEVKDGKAVFTEKDGIDYAATTVQLPGGERVPFLFSLKNLVATSSSAGPIKPGFDLGGSFTVPSYRTGLFLDPKGRGTVTGYDFAGALPGLQNGVQGDERLFNENNKRFDVLKGDVEFAVTKVNAAEGEIGGVFVANQPSDTDMGGKVPKRVLTKGIFYAKVAE